MFITILIMLAIVPWSILFGAFYLLYRAVRHQLDIQRETQSTRLHADADVSTVSPEVEARLRKKIEEAKKETGVELVDVDYIAGKGNA